MKAIASLSALVLAVAGLAAAAPDSPSDSASQPIAASSDGRACGAVVPIERMSAAELDRWMAEVGVALMSRVPEGSGTTDPPLCPERRSCDPCDQGNGPCFLTPFGSDSCCTSPSGPCFLCPKGTTIQVTSCPCFGEIAGGRGEGRCPARDQDWFCG